MTIPILHSILTRFNQVSVMRYEQIKNALIPWFTSRLVLGIDALYATLEVEQRRDGLFQTFSVILVLAALLKLLKKQKTKARSGKDA